MKTFLRTILILVCLLFGGANLYAQTTYDWLGGTSTDWNTASNWKSTSSTGVITNPSTTVPGSADIARIGVIVMTNTSNFPVINAGGATSVGSIVWGTDNYLTVSLVLNTTFTVNGSINNTSAVPSNGNVSAYVFNLTGTGSLTVTGSLNVGYDDGYTANGTGNNNTFTFNSSIPALTIDSYVYLNAYQGNTNHRGFLPTFNALAGTVTVPGFTSHLVNTSVANKLLVATISVGNASGSPTALLKMTGANALSFTNTITNYVYFNNPGATVEYSGAAQTVYTDAALTGLSNSISYYNLKFSGTGIKSAMSGNLYVAGDFTNTMANDASNYVDVSSPTVNFNGTTQNLYGGGGNGTRFYNVAFSNSGTKTMQTGTFQVDGTGILTMSGNSTSLAANGLLTLLSTATSTATVASIPSNNTITGNVTVQRYISGGSNTYRGYRFLSSPIYTAKVGSNYYFDFSYLPLYAPVTGYQGVSAGMTKTGNPTIYLYRDNIAFNNNAFYIGNFRGVNKINNSPLYSTGIDLDGTYNLTVGTGFLFFYRGDLTNIATKYTTTTAAEATVFASTGTLNQQSITVTNWYTGLATLQYDVVTGNAGYSGFNLVGNPYASSIDWNTYNTSTANAGIFAPGVNSTIYIYNEASKVYATYNNGTGTNGGSNVIPSGQGFFVKANTTGAKLVFSENAKINTQLTGPTSSTGSATLLLSTAPVASSVPQYLRLELAQDTINREETLIRFNNSAKNEFVINEDSEHLAGQGSVSFCSRSADNLDLAINQIPFPKQSQSIKLYVNANVNGVYKINLTEVKAIPQLFDVWLMDAYRKDSLDIRHNPTYSFDVIKSDTSSFGANRFTVVIRQNPALGVHLLDFAAAKTTGGAQVTWKTENEQNYTNFTVERSTDNGMTFEVLGGLSSSAQGTYGFLDQSPAKAADQYRLKMEDLNGAITYSNVVTLQYADLSNSMAVSRINVYPNPSNGIINLSIDQSKATPAKLPVISSVSSFTGQGSQPTVNPLYGIKIVSVTGTVVKTATSAQANWQDNLSTLLPGTYFIQVVNNNDKSLVGKSTFVKL